MHNSRSRYILTIWRCAISFQVVIPWLLLLTIQKGSQDLLSYTIRRGASLGQGPSGGEVLTRIPLCSKASICPGFMSCGISCQVSVWDADADRVRQSTTFGENRLHPQGARKAVKNFVKLCFYVPHWPRLFGLKPLSFRAKLWWSRHANSQSSLTVTLHYQLTGIYSRPSLNFSWDIYLTAWLIQWTAPPFPWALTNYHVLSSLLIA